MMTSEGKVAMDVCQNSGPTPSHCPRTTEDIAADDSGCADSREEDTVRIEPEGIFGRYSPSFLKERGNAAYKDRDYIGAREFYSEAIARLEHTNNDILRAQLYANRAACHMAVEDFDAAVEDTTDAIMLDSSYVKAYLRRSAAYERKGMQQKALADLEKAVQLDGSIEPQYRDKVCKLRKLAEKELEKEKEEMIGKLKNLGNSLLGKVGLSLDNFKVNKDHATGSYNIQFQS